MKRAVKKAPPPLRARKGWAIVIPATGSFAVDCHTGRLEIFRSEKEALGFVQDERFEQVKRITITVDG